MSRHGGPIVNIANIRRVVPGIGAPGAARAGTWNFRETQGMRVGAFRRPHECRRTGMDPVGERELLVTKAIARRSSS